MIHRVPVVAFSVSCLSPWLIVSVMRTLQTSAVHDTASETTIGRASLRRNLPSPTPFFMRTRTPQGSPIPHLPVPLCRLNHVDTHTQILSEYLKGGTRPQLCSKEPKFSNQSWPMKNPSRGSDSTVVQYPPTLHKLLRPSSDCLCTRQSALITFATLTELASDQERNKWRLGNHKIHLRLVV